MNDKRDALLYLSVTVIFAFLTRALLPSSTAPTHLALDCFAGALNNLPFGVIEKGLYGAMGALFLYPVLLRPLVIAFYKAVPSFARWIPRKFVAASNLRVLLFGLMFSAFSGVFVSAGIYSWQTGQAPLLNKEFAIGLWCFLVGLVLVAMQEQFRQIRSSLKKRGPFEALLHIVMLIFGFLVVGHIFLS